MGQIYLQQSQPQLASREFAAVMQAAQADEAPDLAYQWQKELGDLQEQQGNLNQARAATAAVSNLEQIRGTLLASEPEFHFSFREEKLSRCISTTHAIAAGRIQPQPQSSDPG